MASPTDPPPNTAERLITATIGGTWWLWLIGGLYIAGPFLGWALAALVGYTWYVGQILPAEDRLRPVPFAIWLWLGGMGAMLLILFVGHANFDLGTGQTIKSAVGWAKGWALLALFPLAGAVLPIRLKLVVRAVCRLGRQTLILLPIFLAAPFLNLPSTLWVSPLQVLGGSGSEYFAAVFYTIEPGVGTPRWQFFAPWSPAAGMVAVIHFLLAREEENTGWRWTGYTSSILLVLLSQSRLALVAIAVIIPLVMLSGRVKRPSTWFAAAPFLLLTAWFALDIRAFLDKLASDFAGARAESSRVRAALGRIAVERWQSEAYWFGHGIVERGPHLVEYMAIGSHHSWYGLLYVKGLMGALALAVPMIVTLITCFAAATRNRVGRLGLAMILTYWLYSFGENLEVLTYISWPALLAVGIALRQEPAPSGKQTPSGAGIQAA